MDAYKLDCFLAKIEFDDHHHTLKEKSKKALLDLVALIDQIAPTGEDNRREFWFCLPSVPYKKFRKGMLDEDTTEEEIQEWYNAAYPNHFAWYNLVSIHHSSSDGTFYGIFLNGKIILSINDPNEDRYAINATDLIELLSDQTKEVIDRIKAGTYNAWVQRELPDRYKYGLIQRKDYWDIYPDKRTTFMSAFSQEEINDFLDIVRNKHVEEIPDDRLRQVVTARWYYDACQLCYQAAAYMPGTCQRFSDVDLYSGDTAKKAYYVNADGRDDGLINVPLDDPGAFEQWLDKKGPYYSFSGGHPFEIVASLNIGDYAIHLYVNNKSWSDPEQTGFYLTLCGNNFYRTAVTIKMFLALYRAGYPVRLLEAKTIAARLLEKDYVGVVPDDVLNCYSYTIAGTRVDESINLSDVDKKELVVSKVIWKKIPECKMLKSV